MEKDISEAAPAAERTVPFDLNEIPHEAFSVGEVRTQNGAGDVVLVCSQCGLRRLGKENRSDWMCFKCLMITAGRSGGGAGGAVSGSTSSGGAKGVPDLDINAMPPEAEGEDVLAWGRGESSHSHSHRPGNVQGGHATPFTGNRLNDLSSHSLLQRENALNLAGSIREGWLSTMHSKSLNSLSKTSNEVYLQSLRENIADLGGALGDGWYVEFVFCPVRVKTLPVYHSPDGRKFHSMSDVASHLGLGSTTMQKASGIIRKRKEALGSFKSGSSTISSPAGFETVSNHGLVENDNCDSHRIHDGFPVQFEDFFLISAGNIDARPLYHSTSQILPVGYKSSWHDKITGSLFVCEVSDGGDSGPFFKVRRYPCTTQSIPIGSTILKSKIGSSDIENKIEDDGSAASAISGLVDDETNDIQMILTESSPPHLGIDISLGYPGVQEYSFQELNISTSEVEHPSERCGSGSYDISEHKDIIGEFSVEAKSATLVWEMASETLLRALNEAYKQKGEVQFCCSHGVHGMRTKQFRSLDSLSKFSHFAGPDNISHVIRGDETFKATCEMLVKWLGQDRFGLDTEFVQEIIEQIPGVTACTGYKTLKERKLNSTLQTVGSGFLLANRNSGDLSGSFKRARKHSEEPETRAPFPLSKPLSLTLPAYLMGDAFQAWEFSWRFSEILGLEEPFSFQELEYELLNPWLDHLHPLVKPWPGSSDIGGINFCGISVSNPKARVVCQTHSRYTGLYLAEMHGSLLNMLAGELLSRVVVHVDPNFDAGESRSRRGRKRDADISATMKKMMLDMLPINEFTWPEVARRYILAVLSMECNLESSEIAFRESGKVFQCLRGDGGTLCGSLTGVAALEADAVLLAEAMKKIFGSLKKSETDVISLECMHSDAAGSSSMTETDTESTPEWALVLEPVRKLPTNVGARIRKCINEALEKNPPDWARKALERSISREVYKGNASGPTKRAVISVLQELEKIVPQQPEKKEKPKLVNTISDLRMRQCRIILRRVAAADEDRVFCNLLGRTPLNPSDNDDEGLLGYPAMVSRPLDFRSIDLRLTSGAYGGSHEAFFEDVQEVWHSIRTAYRDHPDLIELAERLSQRFEELYSTEVLTLAQRIAECTNPNTSSIEDEKQRNDFLASVTESLLPKAPWEEGICKVCGMDKDDDNVLLCDGCDSEYHRYCLNPPLVRIPEGNWYCPSCVAGRSTSRSAAPSYQVGSQCKQRKYQHKYMETLTQLAKTMSMREYWELTAEERVFLLKFLCDEALNLAVFREHIDQCASLSTDLQQKLRSLTSEWKIQKLREEILGTNSVKSNSLHAVNGEPRADVLASTLTNDNSSHGNQTNVDNTVNDSRLHVKSVSGHPVSSQPQEKDRMEVSVPSTFNSQDYVPGSSNSPGHSTGQKNEVSSLQDAIAHVESEIVKVSLRKEFIGRDSHGRLYWLCDRPGSQSGILVNSIVSKDVSSGNLLTYGTQKFLAPGEFSVRKWYTSEQSYGIANCDLWVSFDSDSEILELVGWLRDNDDREKELKESILHWQRNKARLYNGNMKDVGSKRDASSSLTLNHKVDSASEYPVTMALTTLKKKFGPCLELMPSNNKSLVLQDRVGVLYRCQCLEPLLPSRYHCFSCHQTFFTTEEQAQHTPNCKIELPVSRSGRKSEDPSKSKKMATNELLLGKCSAGGNDKLGRGSYFDGNHYNQKCPYIYEEIKSKFVLPSTPKEPEREVEIIGDGIASSMSSGFPHLNDPALITVPVRNTRVNPEDVSKAFERNHASNNASTSMAIMKYKNWPNNLLIHADGRINEGPSAERIKSRSSTEGNKHASSKSRSTLFCVNRSSLVHELALRPLVGRVSNILNIFKINLLDMEAALPDEALRVSRSYPERRRAWQAFAKSANTIFEMIQAVITLEDMIKGEYLRNDWWYWSSPSAAARTCTLSALALRIYALDSAILYEKNGSSGDAIEASKPYCISDQEAPQSSTMTNNTSKPGSPSMQGTPDSDPPDISRPRTRVSKRRRESGGG